MQAEAGGGAGVLRGFSDQRVALVRLDRALGRRANDARGRRKRSSDGLSDGQLVADLVRVEQVGH